MWQNTKTKVGRSARWRVSKLFIAFSLIYKITRLSKSIPSTHRHIPWPSRETLRNQQQTRTMEPATNENKANNNSESRWSLILSFLQNMTYHFCKRFWEWCFIWLETTTKRKYWILIAITPKTMLIAIMQKSDLILHMRGRRNSRSLFRFHRILWNSMQFHRTLWNSMGSYRN